jgi:hypothetical protein
MQSRAEIRGFGAGSLDLLRDLRVDEISHFDRPLRDHLVGCFSLLDCWGAPSHVCVAGLFHSIYGTETFKRAAAAATDRPRIRDVIGSAAEELVYLFSFGDRRRLLLDNGMPPHSWTSHSGDERAEIDDETLGWLVLIEAANFVEQLPHLDSVSDATIDDMTQRFDAQKRHLPPHVRHALREAHATRLGRARRA